MEIKDIRSWFCMSVTSICIFMFPGIVTAASVDTGKAQPSAIERNEHVRVPTAGQSRIPEHKQEWTDHKPHDPGISIQPKVNIQTPTQNVRSSGPQMGTPKQPLQPKVNIETPTQNVRPATNAKVPSLPQGPKQNLHPQAKPGTIPPPHPVYNPAQNPVVPEYRTPGAPNVSNTMVRPQVDQQALDRIQQIQEAATAAEVFQRINEMNRAQEELDRIGSRDGIPGGPGSDLGIPEIGANHPDTEGVINKIFGTGGNGINADGFGTLPESPGASTAGQQQPTLGGLGTSNASGDSVLKPVVDSVRNYVENGLDGQRDGTASQAARIILGAPIIGAAIYGAFHTQEAVDIANDPKSIHPLLGVVIPDPTESPQPAPATKPETPPAGVDTDGDGVPDSSPPPSPESQPNDQAHKGNNDCNWNPIYGRCMNSTNRIQDATDSTRQPSRGDASTDSGTSYPVVGPDAVTDYEHGHRGGSNRGSMIDMRDPPEDIDSKMGALE